MKTAILIDGGFYRRRAHMCLGPKNAKERANELDNYCRRHLTEKHLSTKHELYRIFYYDCPPMTKKVYHPFLQRTIDFSKTELFEWAIAFLNELKKRRKFALRLGKLADAQAHYTLKPEVTKRLFNHTMVFGDLKESDFLINVEQKGVDMKIGLDIASMAYKKQVGQIVLISGDSDFVSAAKLARREGVDFILDPLGARVKDDLFEHIDGLRTCDDRYKAKP